MRLKQKEVEACRWKQIRGRRNSTATIASSKSKNCQTNPFAAEVWAFHSTTCIKTVSNCHQKRTHFARPNGAHHMFLVPSSNRSELFQPVRGPNKHQRCPVDRSKPIHPGRIFAPLNIYFVFSTRGGEKFFTIFVA